MTKSQVEYMERMMLDSYERRFGVKPRMWLRYPSHRLQLSPNTCHLAPDTCHLNMTPAN